MRGSNCTPLQRCATSGDIPVVTCSPVSPTGCTEPYSRRKRALAPVSRDIPGISPAVINAGLSNHHTRREKSRERDPPPPHAGCFSPRWQYATEAPWSKGCLRGATFKLPNDFGFAATCLLKPRATALLSRKAPSRALHANEVHARTANPRQSEGVSLSRKRESGFRKVRLEGQERANGASQDPNDLPDRWATGAKVQKLPPRRPFPAPSLP